MARVDRHPADLPAWSSNRKSLTAPTRPSLASTAHPRRPVTANSMGRCFLIWRPNGFSRPEAGAEDRP